MKSMGAVPINADLDPYFSEVHFRDINRQWEDPALTTPSYTSHHVINVRSNCPKSTEKSRDGVAVNGGKSSSFLNGGFTCKSSEMNGFGGSYTNESSEVTFNKDVHESLQTFCDGLLTGLFKSDGTGDDVSDTSRKKSVTEPSNRTFKCDAVMLRKELRESLHEES